MYPASCADTRAVQNCWIGCLQAGGSPAAHAASPSADDKCIMDEATQPVEAAQPSKAARKEKRARKQRRRAKKLAAAALTTEQASLGAPSPAPAAADAAKGACHTST